MHKKEIPNLSLKLGNANIEKVDDFNYLGLTVDTNLNWKKHTEKVANRCAKKIGVLNRLKYVLPLCIKTIYLIIRRCARTGAFPGAFCVPNSVALASPTLWGVQWAIH